MPAVSADGSAEITNAPVTTVRYSAPESGNGCPSNATEIGAGAVKVDVAE